MLKQFLFFIFKAKLKGKKMEWNNMDRVIALSVFTLKRLLSMNVSGGL